MLEALNVTPVIEISVTLLGAVEPSMMILAAEDSAPLSAFVWWLIPLFGFLGAIAYVIWISKFQTKYENQTTRSVDRFQRFQESLDKDRKEPRGVRKIERPQESE